MRVRLCFLSSELKDPLLLAAADYLRRADRRYDAGLVPLKPPKRPKQSPAARIQAEEARALELASAGCARIALDAGGTEQSSAAFAEALEGLLAAGRPLAFLIGGPDGLDPSFRARCDQVWSLSALTLPHRLAVCVLAEQIYRAGEIARGGPYHK